MKLPVRVSSKCLIVLPVILCKPNRTRKNISYASYKAWSPKSKKVEASHFCDEDEFSATVMMDWVILCQPNWTGGEERGE